MASFHDLTTSQLKQAVQIREQIESLQAKLNALLGGSSAPTKVTTGPTKGKRTISAAHRAKLAAAQKARWAKLKSPAKATTKKPTPAIKIAPKAKRNVSPEVRAKLAAAMKARWAAKRKAGE